MTELTNSMSSNEHCKLQKIDPSKHAALLLGVIAFRVSWRVLTLAGAPRSALAAVAGHIHLHEAQELVLKAAFWAATQ